MSAPGELVLPGDVIRTNESPNIRLGPGLFQLQNSAIVATRAGELRQAGKNKYWVQSEGHRYIPGTQDPVVGVVIARSGESYKVDIGAAHPATLDALAFEGASKRFRPNLKVGSLVYARVSLAHKDMEPELECFDAQTRKAEGFGELKSGFQVACSLKIARGLLDPVHFLLPLLGSRFQLEVAIGVNGRVWFKTPEVRQTIAVARCIEAVDEQDLDQAATVKFLNTIEI